MFNINKEGVLKVGHGVSKEKKVQKNMFDPPVEPQAQALEKKIRQNVSQKIQLQGCSK